MGYEEDGWQDTAELDITVTSHTHPPDTRAPLNARPLNARPQRARGGQEEDAGAEGEEEHQALDFDSSGALEPELLREACAPRPAAVAVVAAGVTRVATPGPPGVSVVAPVAAAVRAVVLTRPRARAGADGRETQVLRASCLV